MLMRSSYLLPTFLLPSIPLPTLLTPPKTVAEFTVAEFSGCPLLPLPSLPRIKETDRQTSFFFTIVNSSQAGSFCLQHTQFQLMMSLVDADDLTASGATGH